jgi:hypothetical protein
VPSELVMAVVTALTTKGAEVLVTTGKNKLAALFRVVHERFSREGTRETAILRAAIDEPDDQVRRQRLAELLARLLAEDPAFRDRLALSWREASAEAAVSNYFAGSATKVVQARDIYGDVTF